MDGASGGSSTTTGFEHNPPPDPGCPFCNIAEAFQPADPVESAVSSTHLSSTLLSSSSSSSKTAIAASIVSTSESSPLPIPGSVGGNEDIWNPSRTFPPTFVVLRAPDVIAFFDIAPLTRGHILVASRRHRVKAGDLGVGEAGEIGRWLPIISRAVVKTVLGVDYTRADWNIVQNNGPRAAQVVPHVHFHIVPRPRSHGIPTLKQQSWTMFGRGQRTALDEEETAVLAQQIRQQIRQEVIQVKELEGVDLCQGWRVGSHSQDEEEEGGGKDGDSSKDSEERSERKGRL